MLSLQGKKVTMVFGDGVPAVKGTVVWETEDVIALETEEGEHLRVNSARIVYMHMREEKEKP